MTTDRTAAAPVRLVGAICDHHYDPLGGCEGTYDETGNCDTCGRPPIEAWDVDFDAMWEARLGDEH